MGGLNVNDVVASICLHEDIKDDQEKRNLQKAAEYMDQLLVDEGLLDYMLKISTKS